MAKLTPSLWLDLRDPSYFCVHKCFDGFHGITCIAVYGESPLCSAILTYLVALVNVYKPLGTTRLDFRQLGSVVLIHLVFVVARQVRQ